MDYLQCVGQFFFCLTSRGPQRRHIGVRGYEVKTEKMGL